MNMESTPAPSSALPSQACPRCLSPIPERAPGGLCPRCLLDGANAPTDAGLGTQSWKTPTLAEIASAFPELEVLGHLGTGGMGCVYRLRRRFREGVRAEISQTRTDGDDVQEDLRYLIEVLASPGG